jgi:hypothetical protein
VLGARIAVSRGTTLDVRGEGGRRLASIRATLAERGVRFAEPGAEGGPLDAVPTELGSFTASGVPGIRVRAELDPAPVDFAAVPLGTTVGSA